MLSDRDLAKISNALQAPMIVQDILSENGALTNEVQYGLHEVISEYEPDTALLCIALSVQKITGLCGTPSAGTKILGLECQRIVEEYGAEWLEGAQGETADDSLNAGRLVHILEDLETLATLLEFNSATLSEESGQAASLCKILGIQAQAQTLIAEAVLSVTEMEDGVENLLFSFLAPGRKGNVIPFPEPSPK